MARRARAKQAKAKSSGIFNARNAVALLATVAFLIFFFPYCVAAAVLLLPSAVAYMVDRSSGKFLFRCVAAINLCGILPGVAQLHLAGGDLDALTNTLSNVWNWLYAYAAAAFGWVLYGGVPRVIASYVALKAHNRIKELREVQDKLVEEWGDDVARQVRGGGPSGAEPLGMPPEDDDEASDEDDAMGSNQVQKATEEQIESSSLARPRVGPPMPVAPGKLAAPDQFDDLDDEEMKPGSPPAGLPSFE